MEEEKQKEETPIAYFRKELLSNPIHLANGGSPRWQPTGDDEGLIETKTDWLIAELRKFASRKIGGVVEITKEQYDAKKNLGEARLRQRSKLSDPPQFPPARADMRDVVPVVAKPVPISAPLHQKPSVPEYVQAMPPGSAPADPAANRPIARKIPKLPRPDTQPSIIP